MSLKGFGLLNLKNKYEIIKCLLYFLLLSNRQFSQYTRQMMKEKNDKFVSEIKIKADEKYNCPIVADKFTNLFAR
jgi:hypothetical protein